MKNILLLAAAAIAVSASSASAYEGWKKERFPYPQKVHSVCQMKADRLHNFEVRSARDGRVTRDERRTADALRRDLDRTCGGFRWR